MVNERELDRAIDVATRAMMNREPSRGLSRNVMARVRGEAAPQRLRLRWVVATAALLVCAALALSSASRGLDSAVRLPSDVQLAIAQGPVVPVAPAQALREAPRRVTFTRPSGMTSMPPLRMSESDALTIAPLETEPIALTTIDVPQLERETTFIETIDVAPLTIEPLAASND